MAFEGKEQIIPEEINEDMLLQAKYMRFLKEEVLVKREALPYRQYLTLDRAIIIDNDFLKLTQKLKLNTNVKVFARVSPEHKAMIVGKFKEAIKKERKALTRWQRMMGE